MTRSIAGAAPASHAASPILDALKAFALSVRNRAAVRSLSDMDDHTLKDLGLTRTDVEHALATPYWSDPSLILNCRAKQRRWAVR